MDPVMLSLEKPPLSNFATNAAKRPETSKNVTSTNIGATGSQPSISNVKIRRNIASRKYQSQANPKNRLKS